MYTCDSAIQDETVSSSSDPEPSGRKEIISVSPQHTGPQEHREQADSTTYVDEDFDEEMEPMGRSPSIWSLETVPNGSEDEEETMERSPSAWSMDTVPNQSEDEDEDVYLSGDETEPEN